MSNKQEVIEAEVFEDKEPEVSTVPQAEILKFLPKGQELTAQLICQFYGVIYDPELDQFCKYEIETDEFVFYKFNNGNLPTFIKVEEDAKQ